MSGSANPMQRSVVTGMAFPSAVPVGAIRHRLAPWTPVGRARIRALQSPPDQLAAAPARLASPRIHPQTVARIRALRGAPSTAAIGHDPITRILEHVRPKLPLRSRNHFGCLLARERLHFSKRIQPCGETDLRLEDVAYA